MSLRERMRQEPVDPSVMPGAELIATGKESGPQWAKTPLLAELLEQLRFCMRVSDVITYPMIPLVDEADPTMVTTLTAVADAFFVTRASFGIGEKTLVLVCEEAAIDTDQERRADALRRTSIKHGVDFRILTKHEIRTPYLENARRLGRHIFQEPDEVSKASKTLFGLLDQGPTTVGDAVAEIVARGVSEAEAAETVEGWVVDRLAHCDLSVPYGARSRIWDAGGIERLENRSDALLRIIQDCPRR